MRVAAIGDLSGYHVGLVRELERLGVVFNDREQPTDVAWWPDDLEVIQVGDVVHKGPFSELALAIVAEVLLPTGRYLQLVGNHELQYLGGQDFWRPRLAAGFDTLLQDLRDADALQLAAAVRHPDGSQTLLTHAGMTPPVADAVAAAAGCVAGELDAATAAELVNRWDEPAWWRAAGLMLGDHHTEPGVVWAEAYIELHTPWVRRAADGHPPAFDQVHGHTVPLATQVGKPHGVIPPELADHTVRETDTRHLVTTLPGPSARTLAAIDPGANRRHERRPVARVLDGTRVW